MERDVADPSGRKSITVNHWTHPEKTSLSRTVTDVIVKSKFFGNRSPGLLIRSSIIKGRLDSTIDFGFEIALIPLIASRTKKFDRCGCGAVPHGAGDNEGGKEDSGNRTRQNRFNVSHPQGFIEPFGGASRYVKNASDDANNAGSNVVSNDSTWIKWIESFRSPRWLDLLKVTCDAVGV